MKHIFILILLCTSAYAHDVYILNPEYVASYGECSCSMYILDTSHTHDDTPQTNNNSGTSPSNTVNGIGNILNNITNPGGNTFGPPGGFGNNPDNSGDFGLDNLRINGGASYTSFDDANINSSGHFRELSLTLSGDLTEDDTISIGFSSARYETGGANGILARTNGINFSWIHHLNENYGVGAFGLLNSVDIEEINGNTFSYGYGLLFTTFHSFEYFNISTATALAHTDFDTGYDQLFMTSLTLSRSWTDNFSTYLTLSFTDSLKSDPDSDPSYGTWEIGATYIINDNLFINLGFQRTEFLQNYSDNTILIGIGYQF